MLMFNMKTIFILSKLFIDVYRMLLIFFNGKRMFQISYKKKGRGKIILSINGFSHPVNIF